MYSITHHRIAYKLHDVISLPYPWCFKFNLHFFVVIFIGFRTDGKRPEGKALYSVCIIIIFIIHYLIQSQAFYVNIMTEATVVWLHVA